MIGPEKRDTAAEHKDHFYEATVPSPRPLVVYSALETAAITAAKCDGRKMSAENTRDFGFLGQEDINARLDGSVAQGLRKLSRDRYEAEKTGPLSRTGVPLFSTVLFPRRFSCSRCNKRKTGINDTF